MPACRPREPLVDPRLPRQRLRQCRVVLLLRRPVRPEDALPDGHLRGRLPAAVRPLLRRLPQDGGAPAVRRGGVLRVVRREERRLPAAVSAVPGGPGRHVSAHHAQSVMYTYKFHQTAGFATRRWFRHRSSASRACTRTSAPWSPSSWSAATARASN